MDGARATLTAVAEIAQIGNKAWLFYRVAVGQVKAGAGKAARTSFDDALETMQDHASDNLSVLHAKAVALAQAPDFDAAIQMVKSEYFFLTSADGHAALSEIVLRQAHAGYFSAAIENGRRLLSFREHASILTAIAILQANSGNIVAARECVKEAIETAQRIDGTGEPDEPLGKIAVVQAELKDFAPSLQTLECLPISVTRASVLRQIAIKKAAVGDAEGALQNFETAIQIAETVGDLSLRREIRTAKALVQGDPEAALKELQFELEGAHYGYHRDKAEVLCEMAVVQSRMGDNDAAGESLQSALRAIRLSDDPETQIKWLCKIADAFDSVDFGEQALSIADSAVTKRNQLLPDIAAEFVKRRDKEHFKRLLIPCALYLDAAYRMCGLLGALYSEHATAIALLVRTDL